MDFETLINSPKEVIKEYLEEPKKLKEMKVNLSQLGELIKKAGESITYVENIGKCSNLIGNSIDEEEILDYGTEICNFFVDLIKDTGKLEEYLKNEEMIKRKGLFIILAAGKAEEYLTPEKLAEFELQDDKLAITELIRATGKVEEYLTPEKLAEFGLKDDWYSIISLIKTTGKAEEYLTPKKLAEFGLKNDHYAITELIKATRKVEEYLTSEKLAEFGLLNDNFAKTNLIIATGKVEEYLTPEKLAEFGLMYDSRIIANLIRATGKIGEYLNKEKLAELGLMHDSRIIVDLIIDTGKIEKYLTPEKLVELDLDYLRYVIAELIHATPNPGKYLFEGQDIKTSSDFNMANIIKGTGRIEEYLTPEKLAMFGLRNDWTKIKELIKATNAPERYLFEGQDINDSNLQLNMANIIKGTGRIEEYLTPEKLDMFWLRNDWTKIKELIKAANAPERYLFEGQDINDSNLQLNMANIEKGILVQSLTKEDIETVLKFGNETIKAINNIDESKQKDAIKILDRLSRSNSTELRRIKEQMALQILKKEPETYERTLNAIENIYLTSNIPDVGKLYLVFKELHPNLLGEDTKMQDASVGEIPSLENASSVERKNIIFSRLLMSAIESNSRNLKEYVETIEQANNVFKEIRTEGKKLEEFSKREQMLLSRYSEMLNTLYNQTYIGRRASEKRQNTGNIENDLEELAELLNENKEKSNLPDKIVAAFGFKFGIRSLAQAKEIMEKSRAKADERNTEFAKRKIINIEEGDFVKGIENTEYFPSMLQRGILAKDFLGGDATSDATPLDTDVEKVTKVCGTLNETLKSLKVANDFTSSNIDGKKLGRIMLVFSKDNFIETRNQNDEVSMENVELLKQDKDKKEVCHNDNTAYGISMGIGSENIKCIIADKYVDKLGLEIALNGFYIPIVDSDGKVIYTKEMYNDFREKMQGLSHYGEKHFELDETAKKPEMLGIIELVDRSMQNAKNKQEKILKTLEEAVNKNGYTLSDERRTDLKPGIVEFIDTGSTGRGTNMPGDGDFDYMVRMDKVLSDNPTEFKNSLREALRKN